jgi:hypothetical protein
MVNSEESMVNNSSMMNIIQDCPCSRDDIGTDDEEVSKHRSKLNRDTDQQARQRTDTKNPEYFQDLKIIGMHLLNSYGE